MQMKQLLSVLDSSLCNLCGLPSMYTLSLYKLVINKRNYYQESCRLARLQYHLL